MVYVLLCVFKSGVCGFPVVSFGCFRGLFVSLNCWVGY